MSSSRTYDHVLSEEFDDYDDRRRCFQCSLKRKGCHKKNRIYSTTLQLISLAIVIALIAIGLYRYWYYWTKNTIAEHTHVYGGCLLCSVANKMKFPVLWVTAKIRSHINRTYRFLKSAKSLS